MKAVLLTGHGGYDKLDYRTDVADPTPGPGEVLIEVGAAGVNNTDINTRTAWYSKSVTGGTDSVADAGGGSEADSDGSWTGEPLTFPRIQGADCCGRIVAVGGGVDESRIGNRVLVRTMQAPLPHSVNADDPFGCITFGSEIDGGFAELAVARSSEVYDVDCDWTDVELASLPCAFSTAENMLARASLGAERVLITGASGGVGSAAVQLAKRRGAEVVAVCGSAKADAVADLGADLVVDRRQPLLGQVDAGSVDLVVDLVAGEAWSDMVDTLRTRGRYVTAGAIAGPLVELDIRTLYLRDLILLGCTYQPPEVFADLIGYVEAGEIRPVVAGTYPLADIVDAQRAFTEKSYVGKLVLVP